MDKSCSGKKILVLRLSSIGDIIRLVPSMDTINKTFGEVTFLTEDRFAPLLEMYPMARDVIFFPRKNLGLRSFMTFMKRLRENDYDLILDMHGIFKSAFISGLATGKESAGFAKGFGKEFSHFFYNRKLVCGKSPFISRYERYEGALRALGMERGENKEYYPPLINEKSLARAKALLDENGINKGDYVFLFLGASKKQAFKRWPLFRFRELAALIHEGTGLKSMFGWGPDESELSRSLTGDGFTIVPPMLNLQETAALILDSAAFVGVDTGLMHLAALSGINTIAVMGATSPVLNRPWGDRSRIVFKEGISGGCSGENCGHLDCMGKITAEEVFAPLQELLGKR